MHRNVKAGEQTPNAYKPTVFTFERSGWGKVIRRWFATVAFLGALLVWQWAGPVLLNSSVGLALKPFLSSEPRWVSAVVWMTGVLVLTPLLWIPLLVGTVRLMQLHDDRVYSAAITAEEQQRLDSLHEVYSGYWPLEEKKSLWKEFEEETERIYRSHGL